MNGQDVIKARIVKVSGRCAALHKVLSDFQAVIERENAAIAQSNLAVLEALTDEKILFGESVKREIRALKESMDELNQGMGIAYDSSQSDKQLSDFLDVLKAQWATQGLPALPELESLERAVVQLRGLRETIFSKIETNAYLTKKLLQYHRETYAFWQSVAQESEATYGQSGKAKNGQQRSILNVRT